MFVWYFTDSLGSSLS